MRGGAFIAIALLSTAPGCECDEHLVCPGGWSGGGFDPCVPTGPYVDDVQATIGTGVFGFGYTITGNCALDACGCVSRTAPGVEIVVFQSADVPVPGFDCDTLDPPPTGVDPVATATTDSQGRFVIDLPAGSYSVTAVDPIDGRYCGAGVTELGTGEVDSTVFQFYHAAQD